jgi:hypothetical protein
MRSPPTPHLDRRSFVSAATATIAVGKLSIASAATASGTSSSDASFGAVKQINAGELSVAYAEAGPSNGRVVIRLHAWPYDIHSYVDVAPILASAGYHLITALWPQRCKALVCVSGDLIVNLEVNQKSLPPRSELGWWYQYYFATEHSVKDHGDNRHDFNKLIRTRASPKWNFIDATYDRTVQAFNNPDHVAIVIHNYQRRLKLAQGESKYAPQAFAKAVVDAEAR